MKTVQDRQACAVGDLDVQLARVWRIAALTDTRTVAI